LYLILTIIFTSGTANHSFLAVQVAKRLIVRQKYVILTGVMLQNFLSMLHNSHICLSITSITRNNQNTTHGIFYDQFFSGFQIFQKSFKVVKISHITIPTATETLMECLVPNWGISMHRSAMASTSSSIPFTSFPKIIASFSRGRGR
jgi:hypothetical protein